MNTAKQLHQILLKNHPYIKEAWLNSGIENILDTDLLQDCPPHILVTGTNGKGSTVAFLSSILEQNGYKTGKFLSPHLVDVTERIQINSRNIGVKEFWKEYEILCHNLLLPLKKKSGYWPSFFELMLCMAIFHFKNCKTDVIVFETGLGAKKDATKILSPFISLLTNVTFDHVHLLGNTTEEILFEKLGVLRPGCPLIYADQKHHNIVLEECKKKSATAIFSSPVPKLAESDYLHASFSFEKENFEVISPLRGDWQLENLGCVENACRFIHPRLPLHKQGIQNGIFRVIHPCRLETIQVNPLIILDGSHNEDGIEKLAKWIDKTCESKNLILALSIKRNKNHQRISKALEKFQIWFYNCRHPGFLTAKEAKKIYTNARFFPGVRNLIEEIRKLPSEMQVIFTGSLKAGSKLRKKICKNKQKSAKKY